ncbi:hypothetical protein SHIRM173S_10221 [Streptomyces hirsutus]
MVWMTLPSTCPVMNDERVMFMVRKPFMRPSVTPEHTAHEVDMDPATTPMITMPGVIYAR